MKYKYQEIAQQAMEFAYANEGRLPSERELCELCQASRITAKKALNLLRERGLVTRHVGRGTFIADGITPPKVRVLIVSANLPPQLRDGLRDEAEFFSAETGIPGPACTEIGENVIREIQGPGTKIVVWPYSARLAGSGAFSALDQFPGYPELAQTIFAEYADHVPGPDGKPLCVALPFLFGSEVFAFHRGLAEKLGLDAERGPRDWNDILEWSQRCVRELALPATVFVDDIRPVVPLSYYLNASLGQDYLQIAEREPVFDFRGGVDWLNFFRELLDRKYTARFPHAQPDPFTTGGALFRYDMGTWGLSATNRAMRDAVFLPIPPVREGAGSFPLIQKNCLAIVPGGDADGAATAWTFCRHLLGAPAQRRLFNRFSCLAANREVFQTQEAEPRWRVFAENFRSGMDLPAHPVRFGLVALLRETLETVVTGRQTPQEAASKTEEFARLLLRVEAERTWY